MSETEIADEDRAAAHGVLVANGCVCLNPDHNANCTVIAKAIAIARAAGEANGMRDNAATRAPKRKRK